MLVTSVSLQCKQAKNGSNFILPAHLCGKLSSMVLRCVTLDTNFLGSNPRSTS